MAEAKVEVKAGRLELLPLGPPPPKVAILVAQVV
jgi:hypothetical protein